MTLRRTLPLLAAALLALLAIGNATPVAATEDGTSGETTTTRLHPGWNMVGWVSNTTAIAELFEAIPELREVVAWDAEAQEFRRRTRNSAEPGFTELAPGQGLWLDIEGDKAVDWERPVSEDYVLLSLQAGANLVGWSGPDGSPTEDAVRRFGDALHYVYRWDAEGQRFDSYVPDGGGLNTLRELNRGDALWVGLAEEARWWQSGTGGTRFAFGEGVSAARQMEIRRGLTHVIGFFAERYGVEPPEFTLRTGEGAPTVVFTAFTRRPQATEVQVDSTLSVDIHTKGEELEIDLAHEYFHVLQAHLARRSGSLSWMTEGSATYAEAVYSASLLARDSTTIRQKWRHNSGIFTSSLKSLESGTLSRPDFRRTYDLGAMGVDWLVGQSARRSDVGAGSLPGEPLTLRQQADDDSFIEYYRLVASSETWQEAFETAFRISPGDFYTEFERYRDGMAGPVLVSAGDIPPDVLEAYLAEARITYAFFREYLGMWPFTYSLQVAADEESGRPMLEALLDVRLPPDSPYPCTLMGHGWIFHVVTCEHELTYTRFINLYFSRLATRVSEGPVWLGHGIFRYVHSWYEALRGGTSYETRLRQRVTVAISHPAELSELADTDSLYTEDSAVASVAVDWLIKQAREGALAEFYRLLPKEEPGSVGYEPGAGSWQAAFEQAFGLTIDEFYEDFAEYRAGLRQP